MVEKNRPLPMWTAWEPQVELLTPALDGTLVPKPKEYESVHFQHLPVGSRIVYKASDNRTVAADIVKNAAETVVAHFTRRNKKLLSNRSGILRGSVIVEPDDATQHIVPLLIVGAEPALVLPSNHNHSYTLPVPTTKPRIYLPNSRRRQHRKK